MSFLAALLSSAVELIEDRIDAVATIGVHRGTRSVFAATASHFLELEVELELLASGCNVDLVEDQVDALWSRTR
jgi:hypothetical protein